MIFYNLTDALPIQTPPPLSTSFLGELDDLSNAKENSCAEIKNAEIRGSADHSHAWFFTRNERF